ncbi:MAG: ABC transporter permease [Actinobacteria bacterium]|nr:ABC transporter permease [Actinomycetota bacterium]
MRIVAFLKKTFLENLREWKVLILTLVFAPAFVYMMFGYFEAASPAYRLLYVNHDGAAGATAGAAPADVSSEVAGLLAAWEGARHPDGKPVFVVTEVTDVPAAEAEVRARDADLLVEIPSGFSQALRDFAVGAGSDAGASPPPARLVNHADETSVRGAMAMALSDYTAFTYAGVLTQAASPLDVTLASLGSERQLSDFDLYVPALLVLALIMTLFTAATSLVKEVDRGTMMRLMLSRLRTWEFLAAITVNQVLIGLIALGLTYLAALSVGYRSDGSVAMVLLVGAVTTLGVAAIAVVTAALLRSMFELLTVGTFPFFILMFFSEVMFPLPRVRVAELAGHVLYANDVLPPTLGVRALNRVLNYGGGLSDVGFELVVMLLLTAGYFALGTWLFRRRHMRT